MTSNKRLDRIAVSLTPTQIAVQLLQEMHQYPSLLDYVRTLAGKSVVHYPLERAGWQAQEAVRIALKGQDRERRDRASRQAWKDAVFLLRVHHAANCKALEKEEEFRLSFAWLLDDLKTLLLLNRAEGERLARWREACTAWPYPLDAEIAAAVQAAIAQQVQTWRSLDDEGIVADWVTDSFEAEGKTRLPFGAYLARTEGERSVQSWMPLPSLDALRALFTDDASFAQFLAGEDYTCGLADLTDAGFEARAQVVGAALHELIGSVIEAGAVLRLESIPLPFLQDVSLIDGVWADRTVIGLAEFGGLLATQGLVAEAPDDDHLLAWCRLRTDAGEDADTSLLARLRRRALHNLARFPGRTREIAGQPFLHSDDYRAWKGRLLKGKLPGAESGLVIAAWNSWVEAHGGDGVATVGGVAVRSLATYGEDEHSVVLDPASAVDQQRSRADVLARLRAPLVAAEERERRARDWVERARWYLADLYSQQAVFDTLSKRYFAGEPLLFPEAQARLTSLTSSTEELVEMFNTIVARLLEGAPAAEEAEYTLDPATVKASRGAQVAIVRDFLVTQARSKTLDDLGENYAAHTMMERYLAPWLPDDEPG